MVVREMKIGDGTLHYHGEPPEYWAVKTARFRRGRVAITVALALLGVLVLGLGVSPLAGHPRTGTVTSVGGTANSLTTVAVSYVDGGVLKTAKIAVSSPPAAGQSIRLVVSRGGKVSAYDASAAQALWIIGGLLLAVAAGRAVWAFAHRDVRIRFA
jgi:hypothetical protein